METTALSSRPVDINTLILHILAATQADGFRADAAPQAQEKAHQKISEHIKKANVSSLRFAKDQLIKGMTDEAVETGQVPSEQRALQFSEDMQKVQEQHALQESLPLHLSSVEAEPLASAVIVRQGGQIAVYFRPTDNWQEMGSNLTSALDPASVGGHVHRGFQQTLDYPISDPSKPPPEGILGTLTEQKIPFFQALDAAVKAELFAARAQGYDAEVTVGGLSRGGALAQLAASRWLEAGDVPVQTVFSYGSPKVGDAGWARSFEQQARERGAQILRVESGEDIVPELPPAWLGYVPAGTGVYMPATLNPRSLVIDPTPEYIATDKHAFAQQMEAQGVDVLREKIEHHQFLEMNDKLAQILDYREQRQKQGDKVIVEQVQKHALNNALLMMLKIHDVLKYSDENLLDGRQLQPSDVNITAASAHESNLGALASPSTPAMPTVEGQHTGRGNE